MTPEPGVYLLAAVMFLFPASPARAADSLPLAAAARQLPATSDEEVRRIVERAMAAVALAEAQATRRIAELQITLYARDSEIRRLRADLQRITAMVEQNRLVADSAAALLRTLAADRAREQEESAKLAVENSRLAEELRQTTATLAAAQAALADQPPDQTDTLAGLQAVVNRLRRENAELQERITALHTQQSLIGAGRGADTAAAELTRLGEEYRQLEAMNAELREHASLLNAELAELRARRIAADTASEVPPELSTRRVEILEEALDQARLRIEQLEEAGSRLAARLADSVPASRLAELQKQLAAAQSEAIELRRQLAARPAPGGVVAVPLPAPGGVVATPTPAPAPAAVRLSLATADYAALAAIPEIGPGGARAIIWTRENLRLLTSLNDLKSVPGFNDERIESLRKYFTEVPQ